MTRDSHVELRQISKSFGAVTALDDVSCVLYPGEVHAILGENGAGKSTLASILCGFVRPDAGSINLAEFPLPLGDPAKIRKLGIELIHQHFTLVPELTVEENLSLGSLSNLATWLDLQKLSKAALQVGKELGWIFDPNQRVRSLSVGERQRLEIIRVLGNLPSVIVFDEPTAVLAPDEVKELLRVLSLLRDEDKTVVLIAHKLSEVMAIADRVTVLRRGVKVASAARGEFDAETLAKWMVGDLPTLQRPERYLDLEFGLTVERLRALGDRGNLAVDDISFQIRKGEILGIGGVDGNGQVELAETVAKVREQEAGDILWKGRPIDHDVFLGYVPQDRTQDGLVRSFSVWENFFLAGIQRPEFLRGAFIREKKVFSWAQSLISRFAIKVDSPNDLVSGLSGGNQQKVVVSRTLDRIPDLLVVCNPTRGLDIKATDFVHSQVLRAKAQGAAVLLVSSDLDELAVLADRTLFLSRGRLSEGTTEIALVGGVENP